MARDLGTGIAAAQVLQATAPKEGSSSLDNAGMGNSGAKRKK
jgi:hypothetical protein